MSACDRSGIFPSLQYVIKHLVLLYVLETICMDGLNIILVLFLHLECMDHFLINV